MKIRGTRECQSCEAQWSYYETGSIACPSCGSVRSVGVDEQRQQHTNTPAEIDLQSIRQRLSNEPLSHVLDELKDTVRTYTHKRGFISGGELCALDDQYLGARELLHAADTATRGQHATEAEELYVFGLLDAVEASEWPPDTELPTSLTAARGLAVAESVAAYRRDLRTWLDDHPDSEASTTLGSLRDQLKRVEALQGDVPPETAGRLLAAAREIGSYLQDGDETELTAARNRLAALE